MVETTVSRHLALNRRESRAWKRIITAITVLALLAGTYLGMYAASARSVDFYVRDKERACSGVGESRECKWLVFTSAGVFQNADSWLAMKFNSSDVQNKLRPGRHYTARVIGWRIPFFSTYPNITSVEESK